MNFSSYSCVYECVCIYIYKTHKAIFIFLIFFHFYLNRDRVFVTGTLQYNEYWDSGNMLQKSTTIIASKYSLLVK